MKLNKKCNIINLKILEFQINWISSLLEIYQLSKHSRWWLTITNNILCLLGLKPRPHVNPLAATPNQWHSAQSQFAKWQKGHSQLEHLFEGITWFCFMLSVVILNVVAPSQRLFSNSIKNIKPKVTSISTRLLFTWPASKF